MLAFPEAEHLDDHLPRDPVQSSGQQLGRLQRGQRLAVAVRRGREPSTPALLPFRSPYSGGTRTK